MCFILLGLLQLAVLVTISKAWVRVNMKWVPFLHTYRGRGFFLILMGCLATGTSWYNIFIGIAVVLIGLFHVILACWYKDTLDPSEFQKHHQARKEAEEQHEQELDPSKVNEAFH